MLDKMRCGYAELVAEASNFYENLHIKTTYNQDLFLVFLETRRESALHDPRQGASCIVRSAPSTLQGC